MTAKEIGKTIQGKKLKVLMAREEALCIAINALPDGQREILNDIRLDIIIDINNLKDTIINMVCETL